MTFEQLDRSIDADSDSDDELAEQAHMYRSTRLLLLHLPSTTIPLSPRLLTTPLRPPSDDRQGQVPHKPQLPAHRRHGRAKHHARLAAAAQARTAHGAPAPALSHVETGGIAPLAAWRRRREAEGRGDGVG